MYGIEFSTNPDQMNNVIEYQVISSEDLSRENKVQILHNCTSCDAYFMDRDVLRRHIGLIHENKIPLECTYCYAVFIEHKKLTQHKVSVHGEVAKENKNPTHKAECNICHATFRKTCEVTRHINEVHEGKKPFACTLCSSTFARKAGLTDHIASVHDKKKPFKCDLCGKCFAEKRTLSKHTLGVHEKNKPHKCPICPAAFMQKSHMQTHVDSVHFGKKDESKKVNCDVCDSTFCDKKSLKKHVQIVHERKKPFECTFCCKKFSVRSGLNGHLKAMHDESKNEITQKSRDYIKNVYNNTPAFSSRHHRNAVAVETETRMKQDTDDFGELLFRPGEYLDASRIKLLFCDFKKNEKRKDSEISRPRKKVENEKPKLKKFRRGQKSNTDNENSQKTKVKQIKIEKKVPQKSDKISQFYIEEPNIIKVENMDNCESESNQTITDESYQAENIDGSTVMEIDVKMGQIESITEIVTVRPEKSHPLCTSDGLNICDMSKAIIMNSRNNKISPLEYLDQKSVTNIGKLIGLEVQSQDLNARNPKREEKYREIQTAIVHYVRQNCSCHKTVLVTTLPNTNQ